MGEPLECARCARSAPSLERPPLPGPAGEDERPDAAREGAVRMLDEGRVAVGLDDRGRGQGAARERRQKADDERGCELART